MAISILDANLSVRTYNALRRAGYSTLEEVAEAGEKKIAKVRNLGAASLEELKTVMPKYGLAFADEPEKQIFSHEQLDAPKGFILVHAENDMVFYINIDSIAGFSALEYDDGHRATVVTLIYELTAGERDCIIVTETPSEICTLINNTRRWPT